jgi:hypothetical protein
MPFDRNPGESLIAGFPKKEFRTMSYQQKRIPVAMVWVGAWLLACAIFFVFCHTAGDSFLPLYNGVEVRNPLTLFLIRLLERSWSAWIVLFATGAVALFFGSLMNRENKAE